MGDIERRAQIEALRALVAAVPAMGESVLADDEDSPDSAVAQRSSRPYQRGSRPNKKKTRWGGQSNDSLAVAVMEDSSEPITDLDQAREIALNRLAYRSRSRAELLSDLMQRDVAQETATEVVERFTRVGLLDDAEFAAEWVRSRQGPKSLSSSRLRAELRAKGIPDDIINMVLGSSANSDEDVAMKLAFRKAQGMASVDRPVAEQRLAGYLARKGYEPSVVWKAVRAALGKR